MEYFALAAAGNAAQYLARHTGVAAARDAA
jgi:hypothetical protein